jgi:nitroreductase
MSSNSFIPLDYLPPEENKLIEKSFEFRQWMDKRRSVRYFSDRNVPASVIENVILTASSAPSGAHKQPWTFCAISDANIKSKIRDAAEKEEYENYHGRMSQEWLRDLEKFKTDWHKEFLTVAPWLIVIFKKAYDIESTTEIKRSTQITQVPNETKSKNYYVNESVGIAAGMLITAIHVAGLVTLTHTPSPMNFLQGILKRPENERPFLVLPVGYPAENTEVPYLVRKRSDQVIQWFR